MGCGKKMVYDTPTTERCNEMITEIEGWIESRFKIKTKYKGTQRKLLIKTMKDNPGHFWQLTDKGLIHYQI